MSVLSGKEGKNRVPGSVAHFLFFLCLSSLKITPFGRNDTLFVVNVHNSEHLAPEDRAKSMANFIVSLSTFIFQFSPQDKMCSRTQSTFQVGLSLKVLGRVLYIPRNSFLTKG